MKLNNILQIPSHQLRYHEIYHLNNITLYRYL
jgi:hypothetical protein